MRNDEINNYALVFLSVIIFGVIGVFTLGILGLIFGISVGLIVGLLFSILNSVEKVFSILNIKTKSKNEN